MYFLDLGLNAQKCSVKCKNYGILSHVIVFFILLLPFRAFQHCTTWTVYLTWPRASFCVSYRHCKRAS